MKRALGSSFVLASLTLATLTACGDDPGASPAGSSGSAGSVGASGAGGATPPQGPLAKPGIAAPELVKPALRKGPSTFYDSVKFLFEGQNAPQQTVPKGTFAVEKVAVVRGRILDEAGAPLPGVHVSAVGQPAWGSVTTRADGSYDLAVIGGGATGIRFTLPGALSSQRTTHVAWNRYETLEDVVLLAPSAKATVIAFGSPSWQVAAGDRIVDKSGARRTWIAIPPGTKAKAVDAKKVERVLANGTLRLTEFTRGDRGQQAMPGDLPPRSAYTFAAAFAFDEASEERVVFDKTVYAYVEDFLGFPAGTVVPSGIFEADDDVWKREASGLVLGIVGSGASLAMDGTGDGKPDDAASLGLADGELAAVATFAVAGARLWRVPFTHFSKPDFNWATTPPPGAGPAPQGKDTGGADPDHVDNCKQQRAGGSTISCEDRVLGEDLPLVGTSLVLHYQSDRVDGRRSAFRLSVPVTGSSLPAGARAPQVSVQILGQQQKTPDDLPAFEAKPNQTFTWTWDGKDDKGPGARAWATTAVAKVVVTQPFDAVYAATGTFDGPPGAPLPGTDARVSYSFVRTYDIPLGVYRAKEQGFGGWTLSAHHAYDVDRRALHLGSGGQILASNLGGGTLRAFGQAEYDGDQLGDADGLVGRAASLQDVAGIAAAPDGAVYFAEALGTFNGGGNRDGRIRRIDADGSVHLVAGMPSGGEEGDDVLALSARLDRPYGLAWFRGQLCVAEEARVRCLDGKTLRTIYKDTAGGLSDLVVGIDKGLYVSKLGSSIVRIATDGTSAVFAGGGSDEGEDKPALAARIDPSGLGVLTDGTIVFSEPFAHRVRGISPAGLVRTLAGTGIEGKAGDGGPAVQAQLCEPRFLAGLPNGSLLIGDWGCGAGAPARLVEVNAQGILRSLAGGLHDGPLEGSALAVDLFVPTGILPQGDGSVLYGNGDSIHRLTFPYPGASASELPVASPGGGEVFIFDGGGRHLRTIDPLTKTTILSFSYDEKDLLSAVTDDVGRTITIERNAGGDAQAVVSPYGQRTTLGMDATGYLQKVVDPIGRTETLTHDAQGLLIRRVDARGGEHTMTYDSDGRLKTDVGPGGKTWSLSGTSSAKVSETLLTSALGRVSRTKIERAGPSEASHTQTAADGTQATTTSTASSSVHAAADGTQIAVTLAPDPRFGMSSPYKSKTAVTYPSGLTVTRTEKREAERSDPLDPNAVVSLTSTSSVGAAPPWKSFYEAASRTTTTTSPEGRVGKRMSDDHGRTLRIEPPGVLPLDLAYDAQGRVVTVTQGERVLTYTYTDKGYLGSVNDPLDRTASFARDDAGRPLSTTLPGARTITVGFDANDNPTSVIPPGKPAHTFGYTIDDLLEKATAPSNPPASYAYDGDRAPVLATREDGSTITLGYDVAGRWAKTTYPQGEIVGSYDVKTGKLVSVAGPGAEKVALTFDGSFLAAATSSGSVTGVVEWERDARGRIAREKVDGASNLAFEYDDDDLVISFGPVKLGRESESGFINTVQAAGTYEQIERTLSENGATVSYGEPTHWRTSSEGKAVYDLQLFRDVLGRITDRTEELEGKKRVFSYGYDAAGRLSSVTTDGVKTATYTYDANGNRLTEDGTTGLGVYDEQDRVTSYGGAVFTHDAHGDRLSKTEGGTTTTYEHDALGALRKVKVGVVEIAYAVDALGRRVARTENGTVTHRWLYRNALQPVAEYDGGGKLRWRFVYATGWHVPNAAIDASGVTHKIITDQVGSLRAVVRGSDGVVIQRMRHDAWGRVEEDFTAAGGSPLPFGFAGGMFDRGTGLVHFGAREYDPGVGRWVERDPIGFGGGLNHYSYVHESPITLVDSAGESPGDPFRSALEASWDAVHYYDALERHAGTDHEWGGFVYRDRSGLYRSSEGVRGEQRAVGRPDEQEVKPLTNIDKHCPPNQFIQDWHTHGTSPVAGFDSPSPEDLKTSKLLSRDMNPSVRRASGAPFMSVVLGSDGSFWILVPSLEGKLPGNPHGAFRYLNGRWQ